MKWIFSLGLLGLMGCSNAGAPSSAPGPQISISEATTDKIPDILQAYGVDGLVISVAAEGQELLSQGYGVTLSGDPFTADSPCSIYSATKALSSLTLASMLEDELFDINTPLGDYLEDAPQGWQDIPFWRLLNHTSGIPMIVNKPEFGAMAEDPKAGNRDIYDRVKTEPLDYAPGEYSRYRQSGYAIAEMIYSEQLGKEWRALTAENLTGPAGTTATFNPALESGERTAPLITSAGGFQTTANDMAAIFKALNAGKIVSREGLEALLYTPEYNFSGYSLGSILSEVDGEPTLGHRGGGRANIRYAPRSGVGVFVCTDDRSNREIMVDLADMLMQEVLSGKPAPLPVQLKLYPLTDQPAKAVIAAYNDAKTSADPTYEFSRAQSVLNSLGYGYLADDKMEDAITLFELNAREFPASANAHDSLGEAYRSAGRIPEAIKSYQASLALAPDSPSAKKALEEMQATGK